MLQNGTYKVQKATNSVSTSNKKHSSGSSGDFLKWLVWKQTKSNTKGVLLLPRVNIFLKYYFSVKLVISISLEYRLCLKGPAVSWRKLPFLPWEPHSETGQIALAECLPFAVKVTVNTLTTFLPVNNIDFFKDISYRICAYLTTLKIG